jgi:hypothetical protein
MLADDYKEVIKELSEVKIKVAIADFFITSFKEQDYETLKKIELLKKKVEVLDNKLFSELKTIDEVVTTKINTLEHSILLTNSKLEKISNNAFLEFTNNMDYKKWVGLVTAIISVLVSAGVLDNTISSTVSKDDLNKAVENIVIDK